MKISRLLSAIAALILMSAPVFAQRGAPPPPVPQAMQDVAARIVELVNGRNADGLRAMTMDGAIYLDEDGHPPPVTAWIDRITNGPKTMEISGMRGQTWNNSGWVSFNYTLAETLQDRERGPVPVTLRGTASIVLEQVGGNWMIRMIHGALEQTTRAFIPEG